MCWVFHQLRGRWACTSVWKETRYVTRSVLQKGVTKVPVKWDCEGRTKDGKCHRWWMAVIHHWIKQLRQAHIYKDGSSKKRWKIVLPTEKTGLLILNNVTIKYSMSKWNANSSHVWILINSYNFLVLTAFFITHSQSNHFFERVVPDIRQLLYFVLKSITIYLNMFLIFVMKFLLKTVI